MLEYLSRDIWANILPFLNQFDANRLICICRSLKNNAVLKHELKNLKLWTEQRADVAYVNADFITTSEIVYYINTLEKVQFKHSITIGNRPQAHRFIRKVDHKIFVGYFMFYDIIYESYLLCEFYTGDRRSYLDDAMSWNIKTRGVTVNLDQTNINYYTGIVIDENNFTDFPYQYPPACKIHVKLKPISCKSGSYFRKYNAACASNKKLNYAFEFYHGLMRYKSAKKID